MISLKRSVVVFDMDGTLVSSFPLIIRSITEVLKKYPNEISPSNLIQDFYGPDEEGMFRKMLKDPGLAGKAFKEYLSCYSRWHHDMLPHAIDGIPELLRELRDRRTLRLGLVTGRSKESLDITLDALGLRRFFEDIESGSARGPVKQESMRRLMTNLGVEHTEVIYIGDALSDVNEMRGLRIPTVSVWYDHPETKDLLLKANPGMAVGSVEELRDLLLKKIR